ncbi:zinc finger protein 208-like isoform X1 [Hylaeus anthracinus]|uniref:zinc finger protein 208-like isoform X1 n=1 Tax=Hylaeus anthracinus TaxID=313031 RepID=UPI0023B99AE3|nr:zinc finger protein 208-like isoform X1 [Hylaeus anthracinus]XP_054012458.1 zinc finger protein 208-like isoform X1 [Hylaeus anthracinus]XP_054012459.1 zinc finger protein 208-like isoform X1 [Hylaeus anthracinus]XP_054012460.1 zinc finger protein 208-like isoform X1 [Hylaeus anthracinus]XP_054012462.1 zinc finger protein 208-like isoform X1 [Hylaeus anthracinus]
MARVCIYERAVNAVLADVTFYDKLNQSVNGIKIKDEIRDQPDTNDCDASLAVDRSSPATRSKSRVIEDRYLLSTNNKENERVSYKRYGDSKNKVSNVNERKRKCSLASENLGEQGLRTANKRRKYSRGRGRGDQYRARKRKPKYSAECDVCLVLFTNESELKSHKLVNGRGYRCACDKCNAVFSLESSLLRHKCLPPQRPQVRGRKYFICNFCDRRFSYRKPLQSHLFHIHGNHILPSVDEVVENVDNGTIEDAGHHVTNGDAVRVVEDVSKGNVEDHVANSPTRDTLNSSNGSPRKKLRQTTLTEFLPFLTKKECVTPEKVGSAEKTVVIPTGNVTEGINLLSQKGVIDTPMGNKNSGCLARIETDSFIDIIPFDKIKIEPEDPYVSTPSQNASRRLKQMVSGDGIQSSVKLYNEMPLEPVGERGSIIVTRRKKRESAQILWERKLKAEYKCKECVIPLERCEWILKGEHLFNESERSMLERIASIKTKENSNEDRLTSRNYPTLKALDVPLVRVNKVVNVKTNEDKERRRKRRRKRVTTDNVKVNNVANRCRICKMSFSSKKNMSDHMKLQHTIYISSICNARYTSKFKLWHHYLIRHTNFASKKCHVCHEKLKTRVTLKRHMVLHCIKSIRSRHDRLPINREARCNAVRKLYQCRGCGKRYWWKSCLDQHRRVCSRMNANKNTRKKEEASCGNSINSRLGNEETTAVAITSDSGANNSLTEYSGNASFNTSSGTRFVSALPHPDRSQSQSPTVNRKRLINSIVCVKGYQIDVSGLDKTKFPCVICNRQFQTFQNLCLHERTYCKPADSPCTVCGTAFTTKRLLQRHVIDTHAATSSQTYKYFCKYCNQGFIKKPNLHVHERHFHSSEQAVTTSRPCQSNESNLSVNTVCSVCNLVFESYERFVEHNMYYYKGQVFTCMFCSQTFDGLYMLHHHSKLIHYTEATRTSYAYMCDVCNEGFSQESHFHAHKFHVHLRDAPADTGDQLTIQDHNYALKLNNHDKQMKIPLMPYTCDVCTLSFTNETDLRTHEMEYSLDGDFQCSKCERKCSSYAILSKHQSLNHSDCEASKCYRCRFCGEVLTTSKSIVCHERHFHATGCASRSSSSKNGSQLSVGKVHDDSHDARDRFTCVTCGTRFDKETELKDHLLEYSDIGGYSCDVCRRKFGDLHRLEKHRMKHARMNAVLSEHHCPICHEEFTSAANVRMHILHLHGYETFSAVPTERPIGTRTNSDTTTNVVVNVETGPASSLNGSISSSTDQPQQRLLRCPECYITFDTEINLRKHRLQFLDTGNYICEYCGRKFPRLKLLRAHVNKHSANVEDQARYLKHECLYCDEKFRHLASQYSHIVHLHGDKLNGKNKKDLPFADTNLDLNAIMNDLDHDLLDDIEDDRCSENAPLEVVDGAVEQPVAANPVNESNGEQEVSSSTVVNAADEECISRGDATDSKNLYTCPICSLTFTASNRFKLHFKFTHCDSTFAEERVFMERARKVQATLSSTGHEMPKDFNVDVDDSDVVEIIFEKKARNGKCHPKIPVSDKDNSYIQVSRDCYLRSTIKHIGSSPVANAAAVTGNLSKLKVKSFAKFN